MVLADNEPRENALHKLNSAILIDQTFVFTTEAELNKHLNDLHLGYSQERTASCAAIAGSMLGAIGGCLVGIGLLAVPGIGALMAVGTSGTALAATLAGAGIGAASGSLISALAGSGASTED